MTFVSPRYEYGRILLSVGALGAAGASLITYFTGQGAACWASLAGASVALVAGRCYFRARPLVLIRPEEGRRPEPVAGSAPPEQPAYFHVQGENAFLRGKSHGTQLAAQIQRVYRLVLGQMTQVATVELRRVRDELVPHIPEEIQQEMMGIAEGAGVSMDNVLDVHVVLELLARQQGCSALGRQRTSEGPARIMATNDFRSGVQYIQPCERYAALERATVDSVDQLKNVLRTAPVRVVPGHPSDLPTLQSIVFDADQGDVHLALGHQATAPWVRIPNPLGLDQSLQIPTWLGRNLDWDWKELAAHTVLLVVDPGQGKRRYINVTWAGYCGVLSGMNDRGVALAYTRVKSSFQQGEPLGFVFRRLLQESSSVADVARLLTHIRPAASGILVVTGRDGIARIELDPARAETGHAAIAFGTP